MKISVAGIIVVDSYVFIARRLNIGQMGNRWEFPGGKVEDGEDPKLALRREYKEEFNADVSVGKEIATGHFTHNGCDVKLIAYEVSFNDEDINWILTEHSEVKWVPLDEIPKENFVDSDLMLYDDIKRFYGNCNDNTK